MEREEWTRSLSFQPPPPPLLLICGTAPDVRGCERGQRDAALQRFSTTDRDRGNNQGLLFKSFGGSVDLNLCFGPFQFRFGFYVFLVTDCESEVALRRFIGETATLPGV